MAQIQYAGQSPDQVQVTNSRRTRELVPGNILRPLALPHLSLAAVVAEGNIFNALSVKITHF